MRAPAVSVLLPARNAERTLAAALRSVQRQTLPGWECLVIDDGSRDATARVAASFAAADPRFRLYREPPRGLVPALNQGLDGCAAPVVARMDADDCMHPRRLERQLEALRQRLDLAGVGCGVRLFPRCALSPGRLAYEGWLNRMAGPTDIRRERFIECPLAHPTWMMRTAVLQRFRYRDRGWPEDYDLLLRLSAAGLALGTVPEPLLAWRDSPSRLSRADPRYRRERFAACQANFLARDFLFPGRGYLLWGHGPTGRRLRRALARLGLAPEGVVEVHPRRVGQRIAGAPVIAPRELGRPRSLKLVTAVSGGPARAEIRALLEARGWREGTDFVCAA